MYQIYPLGSPGGKEGQGGGFFGNVPAENDGTSKPTKDILEIRKYYEHFKKIGITAIYFSPIFESETHGLSPSSPFVPAYIFHPLPFHHPKNPSWILRQACPRWRNIGPGGF